MLFCSFALAVFSNPGIPAVETYQVKNYINKDIGFVTASIKIELRKNDKGKPYYYLEGQDGAYYKNIAKVNYADLSTISEEKYDLKKNELVERIIVTKKGNTLFNKEKDINKKYKAETPIYSRYAYLLALRGFPFDKEKEISFKSYLAEYPPAALNMRLRNLGTKKVKTLAGVINCYKLELSVGGWQAPFSGDRWYLYFAKEPPHYFVKFTQKVEDGSWLSNELIEYTTK